MGDSMGQPHWRCLFLETGTWTSWRLFLLTTLRSRDILGLTESYPLSLDNNWLVVSNICYFPFHIWDVIRNPLTNSIIFHGYCTTNQIFFNGKSPFFMGHFTISMVIFHWGYGFFWFLPVGGFQWMGCDDSSDLLAASQDLARFVEETVSGRNPGDRGATLLRCFRMLLYGGFLWFLKFGISRQSQ